MTILDGEDANASFLNVLEGTWWELPNGGTSTTTNNNNQMMVMNNHSNSNDNNNSNNNSSNNNKGNSFPENNIFDGNEDDKFLDSDDDYDDGAGDPLSKWEHLNEDLSKEVGQAPSSSSFSSSSPMQLMPSIAQPPATATAVASNNNSLPNTAAASPEEVERLLASDLFRLSMQEREQAMNDLHGIVSMPPEEQPENMQQLLDKMQRHLDNMQWLPEASAYRRALQRNADFVASKRKMFLRAEGYQPQEAATRMLRYFTMKLDLWGADKLCQMIRLKDLSPTDLAFLEHGNLTISPYKDMAGRVLIWGEMSFKRTDKDPTSYFRASWYVYMASVEDSDDSQRRGVVMVTMDIPHTYRTPTISMRDTIPVKFAAIHTHFLPTDSTSSKVPVVLTQAAKEQSLQKRVRYRSYRGSRIEAQVEMMGYGIPMEAAPPLDNDGRPTRTRHLEWIKKRWEIETKLEEKEAKAKQQNINTIRLSSSGNSASASASLSASVNSTSSSITSKSTNIAENDIRNDDVLFGKEKKVVNHPGNTRFRQLIDMYLASYESAPRGEKTSITKVIVEHVHASAGRFLKRGPGKGSEAGWVEVDTDTAYDKITHAFRNRRKYHTGRSSGNSSSGNNNNNINSANSGNAASPMRVNGRAFGPFG